MTSGREIARAALRGAYLPLHRETNACSAAHAGTAGQEAIEKRGIPNVYYELP